MLGVPNDPQARRMGVPTGVAMRLGFLAVFVASLLYIVLYWNPEQLVDPTELAQPPLAYDVPELDTSILSRVRDGTREERLLIEGDALQHLLERTYNSSNEISVALGMPAKPVPVSELRADPGAWRARWIHYKGRIERLSGPHSGHPIEGCSIYEATLELPDGEHVLFTFSSPPGAGLHVGGWARAEGYLLKIRDLTFPTDLREVPQIVGKELQLDYKDWGPVAELDHQLLDRIIDTRLVDGEIEHTPDAWRSLADDQHEPLWHLAAYAMTHADEPLARWRRVPALSSMELYNRYKRNEVPRGTPARVLGRLCLLHSFRAAPNPAGIRHWTEAWVQVHDLGGKTFPIWVPDRVELPLGRDVEVHGYYFRRYTYESRQDKRYWTPLFVAATVEPFSLDIGPGLREIGWVALSGAVLLILLAFWGVQRERRRSRQAEEALLQRRRRRRLGTASAGGGTS